MNQETINPILFGLVAGVITYLILYVDVNYENKKLLFLTALMTLLSKGISSKFA